MISVKLARLPIHGKQQYDLSLKQLIFRVEIKSTKAASLRSVSQNLDDLKTLIQHKCIAGVQYYNDTSMPVTRTHVGGYCKYRSFIVADILLILACGEQGNRNGRPFRYLYKCLLLY